jgi:hypothetical protein
MLRKKPLFLALLIFPLLLIGTRVGIAQDSSLKVTGELPKTPLAPPNISGPIRRQANSRVADRCCCRE